MSVTPAMLAVALGQAAPISGSVTDQQWQMWIDDAQMLIDIRTAELNVPAPDETKVNYVIREAVVAHIRKPDDATQVTISVDDASSSRTYQSGNGRVTIIDEWWAILGLIEPNDGAYSIDMVQSATYHLPWCSITWGAYCSCGTDIAGRPIYEVDD